MNIKNLIKKASTFNVTTIFWKRLRLEPDENNIRNYPAPWLRATLGLLEDFENPVIVEIGSTRHAATQKCADYFDNCDDMTPREAPDCCQDGHSAYFWARAGYETHTVDIDPRTKDVVEEQYKWHFPEDFPDNLHMHIPEDGIEFLKNFDKKINLLYLDGWDVGSHMYAERHLEAFLAAEDKLAPEHIISIDDTDFICEEGGKDKLLTPHLLDKGYIRLIWGRQTVFVKAFDSNN